jgi:hypothetical protein
MYIAITILILILDWLFFVVVRTGTSDEITFLSTRSFARTGTGDEITF